MFPKWWNIDNDDAYDTVWVLNGEVFDFDAPENERTWEAIVSYMDDDIREALHAELAPCTNSKFLDRYLKEDPDFEEDILYNEFGFDWDYAFNKSRI